MSGNIYCSVGSFPQERPGRVAIGQTAATTYRNTEDSRILMARCRSCESAHCEFVAYIFRSVPLYHKLRLKVLPPLEKSGVCLLVQADQFAAK